MKRDRKKAQLLNKMFLQFILMLIVNSILQENIHGHIISHDVYKLTGRSKGRAYIEEVGRGKISPIKEREPKFWRDLARQELEESLKKQHLNLKRAKNIIFFLGDGMSLSTITAARWLKGQRKGNNGEEEVLSFEKFPYSGLSKTYCTDAQVADSACSATAYLSGVKGNIVTIGVSAHVMFDNCTASMDTRNHVTSIAEWAQNVGKSTGFITTTSLTHASPSGLYAHVANRLYESDADVRSFGYDPDECMDIATQLITQKPGRSFDIKMGGGMSKFLSRDIRDCHGNLGVREDGKNLLASWQSLHPQGVMVNNRQELLNLNFKNYTKLLGIFQSELMDFHLKADKLKQPSLSEMTEVALKYLKHKNKEYFLFIEGGLIDIGHHKNKAGIALDECLEFEKAVQLARDFTNADDTLIIVTADHAHPLTISGYPGRGNNILGLNQYDTDENGLKYLTLNYPIGIKQYLNEQGERLNLETIRMDTDFEYPSYIKSNDGHHSGDDVGIFASGPFAHLFTGYMQQSTIPHIIAYAACMGDGPTMCEAQLKNSQNCT